MKKSILLSVFVCAWALFMGGCASYVPLSRPENCLNTYNSYWDDFAGSIDIGKIYHYSNKGFDPKMHFTVIQAFEDDYVLVERREAGGYIWDDYIDIGKECTFLIATSCSYADGAKLRDGDYQCVGTWKYKTKSGEDKTVYVFEDLAHPRKEETKKKENEAAQSQTASNEKLTEELKDYLNFCNTYWDDFRGTMQVGKTYRYSNDIEDEYLKFRILQAFPEVGALVYRGAVQEQGKEVSKDCYFLVISSFAYADNALLRDGKYRCMGTWKYETKDNDTKTVYVLLDEENPGEYPENVQIEEKTNQDSNRI